jgi:site-specific recombinase XerD
VSLRAGSAQTSTWDSALDSFLADCRRRNLSAATLENYEWHLSGARTQAFIKDHQVSSPDEMTAEMLRELEGELVRAGLSPRSVDTFHRIFKNFLGYCMREGYGGEARVLEVRGPKLPQQEPKTFTADEEKRLRAALKDRPRDLMLVDLMLATGLRLQEVANLTVDDVMESPQGALIRVRQGKGRKDRVVPLDTPQDRLSARLKRYVDKVRPKTSSERALFLTDRRGRGGEPVPLSAEAIQTLFKRLSRETGIHINPHKFRHTFATRALSAGVDVMALQKALGHTTLTMVSRYVHYQADDLLAAWKQRRD